MAVSGLGLQGRLGAGGNACWWARPAFPAPRHRKPRPVCLSTTRGWETDRMSAAATSPPSRGAVVFLHAHPDDEAIFTGGTLRLLADAGWRTVVVFATGGELGAP